MLLVSRHIMMVHACDILLKQTLEEIVAKFNRDSTAKEYDIHKNQYPDKSPCECVILN